jgi:hypothetical protein
LKRFNLPTTGSLEIQVRAHDQLWQFLCTGLLELFQ